MKFKVLKSYGKDAKFWCNLILKLNKKERDIHFLPEYCQIYKATYNEKTFLAFYGNNKEFIIQPFIIKPITFTRNAINYFDLVNPYGFGGPLISSLVKDRKLIDDYRIYLDQYCADNNIVSEFSCLHPLLKNDKLIAKAGLKLFKEKETVYIDLLKSKKRLWGEIHSSHKRNILKALKLAVSINKIPLNNKSYEIFINLYYKTIKYHKADKRWFFPDNFFLNCLKFLGNRRMSLFTASIKNRPISAYLFIHDFKNIYYFFGGSDPEYYRFRPNNLLIYEIILWAKKNGFRFLHLGGGVGSEESDSLLRFKSGFSATRKPVFSYRIIHNKFVYQNLCDIKRNSDLKQRKKNSRSNYFPYYQQN